MAKLEGVEYIRTLKDTPEPYLMYLKRQMVRKCVI
jgi:hypothetical protein